LPVPSWLSPAPLLLTLVPFGLFYAFLHRGALQGGKKAFLGFALALFLLLVTRLPHLASPLAFLNSDRAVTLLMTKHIAEGVSRPIYFYGQLYHGSLDAYLYALAYRVIPSLPLAASLVNLVLYSMFVVVGAALIRKISGSSSFLYPVLFLSMPITAASFLSLDYLRGFPLIVLLQATLLYLVFEVVFEEKDRPFLLGCVGGMLLWCYQQALTTMVVTLGLAAAALIRRRRFEAWKSFALFLPGFVLGALPHVLAEINNDAANTRLLFLTKAPPGAEIATLENAKNVFGAVLGEIDVNPVVAIVLVAVFAIGCAGRSLRAIYLPAVFVAVLLFTSLSGYPAETRWYAHYRVLTFFSLLIMCLGASRLERLRRPWPKALVAAACLLFSIARFVEEEPRLRAAHRENREDVEWISHQGSALVVGDYFNTLRFAPFAGDQTIITTAPDVEESVRIFELSKYFPLALELGKRWEQAPRQLMVRSHESWVVERWSKELGFSAYAEALPSGRYTLYSRFLPEPSADVLSILSSYLRERYLPEIERFGTRHQVLEKDGARIRFPQGAGFRLPEKIAPPCGRYQESFVFFDMMVTPRGSLDIDGESCEGSIVSSLLMDRQTFLWDDALVSGLPVEGLALELRDEAIDSIDLHLYSFFDFESSIWANRYQQALLLNGREFPVRAGRSLIRYRRSDGTRVQLDSRHQTLLPAHDSRENVVFHDTGIVLERLVLYRGGIEEEVELFLTPASGENARFALGLPE
ncbi:MAG TPA: hypothetical protein VIG29_04265, partial [Vicinamibacteria bacterium]